MLRDMKKASAIAVTALMCVVSHGAAQTSTDSVTALRDSLRAARAAIDSLAHPQKPDDGRIEHGRRRPAIIFQGTASQDGVTLYGVTGTLHLVGPFGVSAGLGHARSGAEREIAIVGEFPAGSFLPFPLWSRLGTQYMDRSFVDFNGNDGTFTEQGSFADAGVVLLPGPWHLLVAGRMFLGNWGTDFRSPQLMVAGFYRVP